MSTLPHEEVTARLHYPRDATEKMGGISNPFMYLSFLALSVIPALRITTRGLFDVEEFKDVPLFLEYNQN
jgi:adenine deaminase